MSTAITHLTGPILLADGEEAPEAWVVGGRFTFERPSHSLTSGSAAAGSGADRSLAEVRTLSGFVTPGLADLHCHIGIGDGGGATSLEEARQQAITDRDQGVLLMRDAGSITDTVPLQQTGPGEPGHQLPHLIRAGRHVARTRRYLIGYAEEVDPAGLPAVITRQAQRSDGWVKLVGDWIDRDLGDLAPCWDAADFRAAAKAAHDAGARITTHTFDEATIPLVVDAGFDCLEHATGLTDDTIPMVAAAGIPVVTTLVNVDQFSEYAAQGEKKFPRYAAHMRALREKRFERTRNAHDAGIPLLVGTDSGGVLGHGLIHEELDELAACGFTPEQILQQAVFGPRRFLGVPALEEGASADLIVTAEDPRRDHRALRTRTAVMLRGDVVA